MLFINKRKEEIRLKEEDDVNVYSNSCNRKKSGTGLFGSNGSSQSVHQNSNINTLTKSDIEQYESELPLINNINIFTEFLKEFISVVLHKFQFENVVENLFDLYSNLLNAHENNHEPDVNVDIADELDLNDSQQF
jgi:hypothetical protein